MKPYYIITPRYRHNSCGVRVMHKLIASLRGKGFLTFLSYETKRPAPGKMIVVMPDIYVNDNSFGKVARYLLYYPRPNALPLDTELIFYYCKKYDYKNRGVSRLWIDAYEYDLFNEKDCPAERTEECFYVSKGGHIPRIPLTDTLCEITANWPSTRRDLANLLKRSKILYTYDANTALIDEARLCGCPVCIIPGVNKSSIANEPGIARIDNVEYARETLPEFQASHQKKLKDCEGDIDNFISITQKEFA